MVPRTRAGVRPRAAGAAIRATAPATTSRATALAANKRRKESIGGPPLYFQQVLIAKQTISELDNKWFGNQTVRERSDQMCPLPTFRSDRTYCEESPSRCECKKACMVNCLSRSLE